MSEDKHCENCEGENGCSDANCACHNPLGVHVGEDVKSQDRFGR